MKLKFKKQNQCFRCMFEVKDWEKELVFWGGKLICRKCSEIIFKLKTLDQEIEYLKSLLNWWVNNKYDENLLLQIEFSNRKIQSLRKEK